MIGPTIQFTANVDFSCNLLGERGQPVEQGFEYNSGSNTHFLTQTEILNLNNIAGVS